MKNTNFIILILIIVLFGQFCSAQNMDPSQVSIPDTAASAIDRLKNAFSNFPDALKKIWHEEVIPTWQKMFDWFKAHILPKIEGWFNTKVLPKAEEQKPIIEKELQKKSQETKEEVKRTLPQLIKSIWNGIMDFFSESTSTNATSTNP